MNFKLKFTPNQNMDINTYSCILLLEGKIVSASHDGYCSGTECEDIEVIEEHYVELECFSDKVIEQLKYLESINALNDLFNDQVGFSYKMYHIDENLYHTKSYGHQSGFCEPSSSGRHHETDFTANKIIRILNDEEATKISISPFWCKAEINEKALEDFIKNR